MFSNFVSRGNLRPFERFLFVLRRLSMLRRTKVASILSTLTPIVWSSDIALYYPRFSPITHLSNSMGELVEVKKMSAEYKEGTRQGTEAQRRAAYDQQLSRAKEIFDNCGGSNASVQIGQEMRAISAARIVLCETLPRSRKKEETLLADLTPLLRSDGWNREELIDYDSCCVCASQYTKSLCSIIQRDASDLKRAGTVHNKTAEELEAMKTEQLAKRQKYLSFTELLAVVEELSLAAENFAKVNQQEQHIKSIRTSYTRLQALRALLYALGSGDFHSANDVIEQALRLRGANAHDRMLLMTIQAEMVQRAGQEVWGEDSIDEEAEHYFNRASFEAHQYFELNNGDKAIDMIGKETLRDYYCTTSASYAQMYQAMARADTNGDVFFPKGTQFSKSLMLATPIGTRDGQPLSRATNRLPCKPLRARKMAQAKLERALKINRKLFEDQRTNAKAGEILRSLACVYADLRDYLYSMGLFNAAMKSFDAQYGHESEETLELIELMEHCQRKLGNEREADATRKRIDEVREKLGLL